MKRGYYVSHTYEKPSDLSIRHEYLLFKTKKPGQESGRVGMNAMQITLTDKGAWNLLRLVISAIAISDL